MQLYETDLLMRIICVHCDEGQKGNLIAQSEAASESVVTVNRETRTTTDTAKARAERGLLTPLSSRQMVSWEKRWTTMKEKKLS